ncbi:MAG: hypothetical protein RL721_98 [Candidatus Eisenbacteria bacterium]|jgi:hypothetical protein
MKSLLSRWLAVVAALALAVSVLGAATTPRKVVEPDKLIILSTSDVKGKNEPCG